jgi:hypothetical protein
MKLAAPLDISRHPDVPPNSADCFARDGHGGWHWRRSFDDMWTPVPMAALVERDHIAHKAFARWIQVSDAHAINRNPRAAQAARRLAYRWLTWAGE